MSIETLFATLRRNSPSKPIVCTAGSCCHAVIAEDFGSHGDPSPEGPQGLIFAEVCDAEFQTCIWASECLHRAGEVLQWQVPVVLSAVFVSFCALRATNLDLGRREGHHRTQLH